MRLSTVLSAKRLTRQLDDDDDGFLDECRGHKRLDRLTMTALCTSLKDEALVRCRALIERQCDSIQDWVLLHSHTPPPCSPPAAAALHSLLQTGWIKNEQPLPICFSHGDMLITVQIRSESSMSSHFCPKATDLHKLRFCPQHYIVWYRSINVFCNQSTATKRTKNMSVSDLFFIWLVDW